MFLSIQEMKVKKELLSILEKCEVNEQGRPFVDDDEDSLPVLVLFDSFLELKNAITPETILTVFSATPLFEEEGCIRSLLNKSVIKPDQLVYVGLRKMTKGEMILLHQRNIRTFSMSEIAFTSHQEVCDAAMHVSRQRNGLVVLLDLSVLDPAFLPGSPPGGMTSRELIYFLQRFRLVKNLKEVIITGCETAPAELLAKLVVELS
jgi:arginase family enzyme